MLNSNLRIWNIFCFCILVANKRINGFEEIVLNGKWTIYNQNISIKSTATVPGSVHTALLANKVIDEPYYRFNDVEYRWIPKQTWTFERNFDVSSDTLHHTNIELVCDGLDTFAIISLNNKFVGRTGNMFHPFNFDIKKLLKMGTNNLNITFESAIEVSRSRSDAYKQTYGYEILPTCPPDVQHGECHVNMIRKEPASFSWDWGPAFAPQGIWRDISVKAFDACQINHVMIDTQYDSNHSKWMLSVTVILQCSNKEYGTTSIEIKEFDQTTKGNSTSYKGLNYVNLLLTVNNNISIKKWWPNGYGVPYLYTLKASYLHDQSSIVAEKSIRFGFRTVELIQEPIQDSEGLSFYFKINGLAMFLKGSNWIPADAFKERVTEDYIQYLLQSSKEVNINVLRVWGGGIYENDDFYNIADELGILIWQDFMFACSMYPTDEHFLATVKKEVIYQVQRLQHHASLLCWSGNNENEVALVGNWYGTNIDNKQYREDYLNLYVDVIKPAVSSLDPSRPFILSSPSNGAETEKEGGIGTDPTSPQYGDVHAYDYLNNCLNTSIYIMPRFASEYGYQSLPSFESLTKISIESDWFWNSPLIEHRQHHENGTMEMFNMIKTHFKLPTHPYTQEAFKDMIYLSQIVQAICVQSESEHYRRAQSYIVNGSGHTMGAMYWQLNDIWQGQSWASIEYGGRWKMLHYFVKNFFQPFIISTYKDFTSGRYMIYVVSDMMQDVSGIIDLSIFKWSSFEIIHSIKIPFSIPQLSSKFLISLDGSQFGEKLEEIFAVPMVAESTLKLPVEPSPMILTPFKEIVGLKDPQLKVKNVHVYNLRHFGIVVSASNPAAFVWLETKYDGHFSNNGFLMFTSKKEVEFYSMTDITAKELETSLSIKSLHSVK